MILTEFHSITHHSSRITYVGQFDVKIGWTQSYRSSNLLKERYSKKSYSTMKSPSIFSTTKPPRPYIYWKPKIESEFYLNRKSSCTVEPFSILDARFTSDCQRNVQETFSLLFFFNPKMIRWKSFFSDRIRMKTRTHLISYPGMLESDRLLI